MAKRKIKRIINWRKRNKENRYNKEHRMKYRKNKKKR